MRRRNERGGVAVLTAAAVAVLVAVAAFAVDLGMQRVVRSDMQALADVVALDTARLLDGRKASAIVAGTGEPPSLVEAVNESVSNNSTTLGTVDKVEAKLIFLKLGPLGNLIPVTDSNGNVVEATGDELPHAVLVNAAGSVDFAFRSGSGGAARNAIANISPFACFRLGSYAASLKANESALGDVFEDIVGQSLGLQLNAVGYMGLADVYVTLDALAAKLGAGTPDELLDLDNLKVKDLIAASADVLTSEGNTSAAAVMNQLKAGVDSELAMNIADILTVGGDAAFQGSINVLDLVAASAFAANKSEFIKTGVFWREPHVSAGEVELKVIEAPKQACGVPGPATFATTSQVELAADLGFTLPNTVGGLKASIPTDPDVKQGTINIYVLLASAKGTLTGITCGPATSAEDYEETRVLVDSQFSKIHASLPFRLKGEIDTAGIVPAGILNGLLSAILTPITSTITTKLIVDLRMNASLDVSHEARTGTADTHYRVPTHTYAEPEPSVDSEGYLTVPHAAVRVDTGFSSVILETTVDPLVGETTTSTTTLNLAELNLVSFETSAENSFIGQSLNAVLDTADELIAPLSEMLGLRVNGADVFGVPRPNCSLPQLVG